MFILKKGYPRLDKVRHEPTNCSMKTSYSTRYAKSYPRFRSENPRNGRMQSKLVDKTPRRLT